MALSSYHANGGVAAGEKIGSGLDFYTITTTVDISAGVFDSASQNRLNRLIGIIALNGQPVLLGTPVNTSGTYTLKFAIEHAGSWDVAGLTAAIVAHQLAGMGFTTGNTSVVINPTL
jgi:hypothetical protein